MTNEILKLDNFGRGITYYNDKICFIEKALPGDVVNFKIIKENSKYIEGRTTSIEVSSNDRIVSKCPYSKFCGGCNFQEYNYIAENKYKEEKIKDLVARKLKLDEDIVLDIVYGADSFYRNKLILHGANGKLGLYENKSYNVVSIDNCIISNKKINQIISVLKDINGISEALVRTSNDLSKVLVNIKGNIDNYEEVERISDVLIINEKVITKDQSIVTNIGNMSYYLSSESFFQINVSLTEKLFDKVLEYVKMIKPKNILDLYCGTGSIGLYVSDYCCEIVGVDYNESNIYDAKRNALLNNIHNIDFICDKVENVIDNFSNYDLVIVDPPRKGLDFKTREYLKKINAKYIIYVSCDPITLIRDLDDLKINYNINEITPFNLFPRTYHVECVSLLYLKTLEK